MKDFVKSMLYPYLRMRPAFIIVGAQKAATTSLYRYLEAHPSIIGNRTWKEVHFFDRRFDSGLGAYVGAFPWIWEGLGRKTFEATPEYLSDPKVPARIAASLPRVRCIALLREPALRAYSGWRMYNSFKENEHAHLRREYDSRSFEQAIEDELLNPDLCEPHSYVSRGVYVRQVERYFAAIGRDRLLVLASEELKENPLACLAQVTGFLGISDFQPEQVQRMVKTRHNAGNYQLPESAEQTLARLREYYRPYNQQLFSLIGRPFPWSDGSSQ